MNIKSIIIYFSFITLVVLCGCNHGRPTYQIEDKEYYARNFQVVVIDSCEYLIKQSGYAGFMAHKGNCIFCENRKCK